MPNFFDPDHALKTFADRRHLAALPWPELVAHHEARWAQDRPAEEIADLTEDIAAFGVSGVDAAAAAARWFTVFWLEQSALSLGLRGALAAGDLRVEGDGPVRERLAAEGSVIFALPHMGPHFLVHLLLPMLGLGAFGAGKVSAELVSGLREVADLHQIQVDEVDGVDFTADFKQVLASLLWRGSSIALYPEYSRSSRRGGATVPFLGRLVHAPTGIARLSQAFGRAVVFVHLRREGPFRYRLVLDAPREAPVDEAGVIALTGALFARTEDAVRRDPGSWQGWRFLDVMSNNGVQAVLAGLVAARGAQLEAAGP
jgi:lauroyl/myristoyl acyltransferase